MISQKQAAKVCEDMVVVNCQCNLFTKESTTQIKVRIFKMNNTYIYYLLIIILFERSANGWSWGSTSTWGQHERISNHDLNKWGTKARAHMPQLVSWRCSDICGIPKILIQIILTLYELTNRHINKSIYNYVIYKNQFCIRQDVLDNLEKKFYTPEVIPKLTNASTSNNTNEC